MKGRRLLPIEAVIVGSLVTIAASIWFWTVSHRTLDAVLVVYPGIAFTLMLVLGSGDVLERTRKSIAARPYLIVLAPAGLWGLYLLYARGMRIDTYRSMAVLGAYLAGPFLILLSRRRWAEPVAVLWLWLPLEFGLIRRYLIAGADLHYAFAQLLAINAGVVAFAIWNRTPNIGYRFEWSRAIAWTAVLNFLIFSAIAIPLGFEIRFIHYTFHLSKLLPVPATFIGIFLFTAVPEEFLFRGLIQNWFERTTARPMVSLMLASLIFGASHLNNGPPLPNYRYFLMATIAGIFYGRAWKKTGSLTSSALVHAMVDTLWSVFFR
jgi:membrane protease YdiL (CAAX protease family)